MSSIKQSVREAIGTGKHAQAARAMLYEESFSIVPELLALIRESKGKELHLLRDILLRVRNSAIVPDMEKALRSSYFDEWKIAFDVLSNPAFGEALHPLVAQLVDPKNIESKRAQAALALGDNGNPEAIGRLSEVVVQAKSDGLYVLAISGCVALAKLGHQELSFLITALASSSEDVIVQVHAVKALKYLVAPNLLRTLAVTLFHGNSEICNDSIEALFFLGSREVVSLLLKRAQSADSLNVNHIWRRLADLIGKSGDEEPEALVFLWERERASFRDDVCYRLGQPIWLPSLLNLFEREPRRRLFVLEELEIITGQRFGLHPRLDPSDQETRDLGTAITSWHAEHEEHFQPGKLYKFGFPQVIPSL